MIWFLIGDYLVGLIGSAAFVYARPLFWLWCAALFAWGWRGHVSIYASNRSWFAEQYRETVLTGRKVGVHEPPAKDSWLPGAVVVLALIVVIIAVVRQSRVNLASHWGLLEWALVLIVPAGLWCLGSLLAKAFEYAQIRRGVPVEKVFSMPIAALRVKLLAKRLRGRVQSRLDLTNAEAVAISDENIPHVAEITDLLDKMVKRQSIPRVVREPGYLINGKSLLAEIQRSPSSALEEVREDYDDYLQSRFTRRLFRRLGESAWNEEQIEADRAKRAGLLLPKPSDD